MPESELKAEKKAFTNMEPRDHGAFAEIGAARCRPSILLP
mgnify:CR=1 FL=1